MKNYIAVKNAEKNRGKFTTLSARELCPQNKMKPIKSCCVFAGKNFPRNFNSIHSVNNNHIPMEVLKMFCEILASPKMSSKRGGYFFYSVHLQMTSISTEWYQMKKQISSIRSPEFSNLPSTQKNKER